MLKKLIRLNLNDLWLYAGVEGGLFLLLEATLCGVMYFVKPEDSLTVCGVLFAIVPGLLTLIFGISHVSVTFEQALRFGQTRRRAMGLTLGVMSFEAVFALALGAVLAALERFACPALWAKLAGMDGWVAGTGMGYWENAPLRDGTGLVTGWFYRNMSGEVLPMPDNTMLINVFTLDWYWWLLALVLGVCGGIIAGAIIQRFGSKGAWIVYGICFGPMILGQLLPWQKYTITDWLFPLLALLFAASLIWSVWSMLHAVVRG